MTDAINKDWSILEDLPGGIVVFQGLGKSNLLYISLKMLDIFECSSLEEFKSFCGEDFSEAILPEDRTYVRNSIKNNLVQGGIHSIKIAIQIRTYSGKVKTVVCYITRNEDIYTVAVVDDDGTYIATEDKKLAFRHFLEDGESTNTSHMDPDYKAYIVWNLTKNLPCTVGEGLTYLTPEQIKEYTYDVHYNFLLSLLKNDENKMKAKGYSRENLLKLFSKGEKIEPVDLSYQLKEGWVSVHTDFSMMEDPSTGDVYIKLQNRNFVDNSAYEKLFESSVKEVFDSVILIDFDADTLFTVDKNLSGEIKKSQGYVSQSISLICQKIGLVGISSPRKLENVLNERSEDPNGSSWEFETSNQRYNQVRVNKAFSRDNVYSVGITDITEQMHKRREREEKDYRNKTIMSALSMEYVSVFEVDLPEHHISVLKIYKASEFLLEVLNTGNYEKSRDAMMQWGVVPEDQAEFKEKTEVDYIRNKLKEVNSFSFMYRSINDRYVELKVVRADEVNEGEPKHVIIGYADRDAEYREKLNKQIDLVNALEQAKAANAAKSIFLSNMSHDIRTPMNAIIGFTDIALKHGDDINMMRDYLKKISLASDQLLALINDVLDMSKIESGKWELVEEPVSVMSSRDNYESIFTSSASKKGVKFIVETINITHNTMICDRRCIDRILMNIISNSIKFTEAGGTVKFTIKEEDTDDAGVMLYTFTISDTGIGMSKEFLEKIFSPFERERTSTVSHQQGTGLGMAIVKSLVERLNGQIHIESQQGKGTTTTVILPIKVGEDDAVIETAANKSCCAKDDMKAYQEDTSKSSAETMTLEGKRILLVDDMDINREIATVILQEQKIIVDQAVDGQQAIDKFSANPTGYDAILMDVQMPIMDGYEATKQIRKLDIPEAKSIPIVAMTANAFAEDRARAIESGMNDHISKPIDVSQLFRILIKYTL